ncbi:histone-lysine N-methyltransferase SETDB1-B isoform X1 [Lates calcarifer]|uniref:Histone-lysine N-methyltransferase SETDB1-B isoform X1 n=1 Tax=Lates calcarifer TaxID=8187 RepID=A0AAJ8AZU6_LATCA|nr:histone-lysine N-methyltransferase SETDB1-B isoform X1 [Lates calcarifer]
MEGDEMEMSKQELQKWIREKVQRSELISSDVLKKCDRLQSLLERREKQAAQLLKLCKSVVACEETVKKQYSLLGLEYRDTDSDDDINITGSGHTPPSPCESVNSETRVLHSSATNGLTPLIPKRRKNPLCLKEPVVILTRLSEGKISALRPRTPPKDHSRDESSQSSDSDVQWEPEEDSSDSDFFVSNYNTGTKKRRKIDVNPAKSHATPEASTNTEAKSNREKKSTPQFNAKDDATSSAAKTSAPQTNGNTSANSNGTETARPPGSTKGVTPVCIISRHAQTCDTATKTPPDMPKREVKVNMNVLARRRTMKWQRAKITEILTKEDGRLKYKVHFLEKGKSLVSGHHIAWDSMPKWEQLFVGARVVVKREADQTHFCPGVLAELPNRKNRMRFLIFIDDHTPVYVALPFFHLVCKPLEEPLDDIPDNTHKDFMKEYVKSWPYPPQTQYRVGQIINAEFEGVQQKCEVLVVDCSLIQVVFQNRQNLDGGCCCKTSPQSSAMSRRYGGCDSKVLLKTLPGWSCLKLSHCLEVI